MTARMRVRLLLTVVLIAALHERCHFEPGEIRIVLIDAQPIHKQTQQYRLVDAATGEFESGYVKVADMATRQPWEDDVPVHVNGSDASRLHTDRDLAQ